MSAYDPKRTFDLIRNRIFTRLTDLLQCLFDMRFQFTLGMRVHYVTNSDVIFFRVEEVHISICSHKDNGYC
jgi:hypothetical protein